MIPHGTGDRDGCLLNQPGLSVGRPRCRQHLPGTYPRQIPHNDARLARRRAAATMETAMIENSDSSIYAEEVQAETRE